MKLRVDSVCVLDSQGVVMTDIEFLEEGATICNGDIFIATDNSGLTLEVANSTILINISNPERLKERLQQNLVLIGLNIPDYDPQAWVGKTFKRTP